MNFEKRQDEVSSALFAAALDTVDRQLEVARSIDDGEHVILKIGIKEAVISSFLSVSPEVEFFSVTPGQLTVTSLGA